MSLNTHSKFYYGFEVTSDALFVDFNEGAGELSAELAIGAYTLSQFAEVLATAMTDAGGQTYSVTVNRATRKLTISAPAPFVLLVSSGSHVGTTAFGLAGFSGADTASSTSRESNVSAGSVYSTQFILQSYVKPEHFRNSTYGTVNKSASGKIEVVSYGQESFIQAEIKYANDNDNGDAVIRTNPTGVDDLETLMAFFTTKAPFEFMPDEDDAETFISAILESTADDQKGLKFKLKEMYGMGLPGYFETGALLFRVLDE